MANFLLVVPLLVILIMLLPPIKAHVVVAGFVGGVLAIIIGGLTIGAATGFFLEGVSRLFGIAPIILFAALALTLAKAGSMSSALAIANKAFKGKVEYIVPVMVIITALATYAAGTGATNILITAPLLLAAVGFIPLVVAALGVAAGAAWSVSPAAAESAFIAKAMGMEIVDYVTFMRPFAIVMWILAAVIAYIGVRKAQKDGTLKPGKVPVGAGQEISIPAEEKVLLGDPKVSDWNRTIPFIVLLLLIFFSPILNKYIPVFTPLTVPFMVLIVTAILVKIPINTLAKEFVDSSKTICSLFFMVGMFIGFTNLLTEIGTFKVIASLPGALPLSLLGVGALIIGFLVSIPAASYSTAVLIMIVPVLQEIGVNPLLFGFLTMMVAQAAMMCPAQVSVAASAHGFRTSIMKIVSNNAWVAPFAGLVVIVMALLASIRF